MQFSLGNRANKNFSLVTFDLIPPDYSSDTEMQIRGFFSESNKMGNYAK